MLAIGYRPGPDIFVYHLCLHAAIFGQQNGLELCAGSPSWGSGNTSKSNYLFLLTHVAFHYQLNAASTAGSELVG